MLNAFKVFTQRTGKHTFKRIALTVSTFTGVNAATYKMNEFFTEHNGWAPLDPTVTPDQMKGHSKRKNRHD